ncbi:DUF2316 family protein [Nocardia sp. NPDC056064]|uniref:DUF2316 family protein n=1 Tax=Nocardia sp. NPDC056064 TaxID=3345701 RepID=UPI0035DE7742
MSLTRAEQARTSAELKANLRLAEVTAEQVRADLGFSEDQLDRTLNCDDAQPQDVWLLRDHLHNLVLARRVDPVPYSVLTERARVAAARWFPLRTPPPIDTTGE